MAVAVALPPPHDVMVAVDDAYAAANKQKYDQWTAVFDQAVLSWWLPSTNFVWLTFCKVA